MVSTTANSFKYKIYLLAFFSSLLISYVVLLQDDVINDDGVVYVTAALSIIKDTISSFTDPHILRWGIYPYLIAAVSSVSSLNIESSALALNTLFFSTSVLYYLFILDKLSSGKKILIAGCAVILMAPAFIAYRDYVIRDAGYWAFWLMALYYFIAFWKKPNMLYVIAWFFCAILAATFRLEGVVFLFFLPLALLMKTNVSYQKRFVLILKCSSLTLIVLTLMLILVLSHGGGVLNGTRLVDIPTYLSLLPERLSHNIEIIETYLLNDYSIKYASTILGAIIVTIVLSKTFSLLTAVYAISSIHGYIIKDPPRNREVSKILIYAGLINFLILVLYASKELFVTGRYVIPLILVMLLYMPFSLVQIYNKWAFEGERKASERLLFPFLLFFLVILFLDALISFGASKAYLKESGHWIEQQYPDGIEVYSNDSSIYFYAGIVGGFGRLFYQNDGINPIVIQKYQEGKLIAARVSRKIPDQEEDLINALKTKPFNTISNTSGDRVLFFKKNKN